LPKRPLRGSYASGVSATTIVAIYAAVIATAGLAWQIYQWWHRKQPRVEVRAFAFPHATRAFAACSVKSV